MQALIVVQRYGKNIVGGAETHARILAEKLHKERGWSITVVTTAAKSYITWANEYPEGESTLNGIAVKRFRTLMPRIPGFGFLSRVLLRLRRIFAYLKLTLLVRCIEFVWIVCQGPYAPGVVRFLKNKSSNYDVTLFFTYLYYPTLYGVDAAVNRRLIVPTAHDEPPFYFRKTRDLFSKVDLILANSESEQSLIERVVAPNKPIVVAGLGIDTNVLRPSERKSKYILYLGRISRGKGVDRLIQYYLKCNPPVELYLAGVLEEGVSWQDDPRIKYLGVLSEEEKVRYIQEACAMVNPSAMESLSLIVLEAVACGIPVLVNRDCEIFRYYEQQMSTVLGFEDEKSFAVTLAKILGADWRSPENLSLLENSRRWVQDRYSWEAVLNKFSLAERQV